MNSLLQGMEQYWWRQTKVVKKGSRFENIWSCWVWSWCRRIAPSISSRLTSSRLVPSQLLLSQGTIHNQTFKSSPSLRGDELWKTRKGSCFQSNPSLATRWQASGVQARSQDLVILLWGQSRELLVKGTKSGALALQTSSMRAKRLEQLDAKWSADCAGLWSPLGLGI